MAKKKAMKAKHTQNSDDGAIVDERFIAAETRPQFKTGRKFKKDKSKVRAEDDDHADGGNLHTRSSQTKAFEETFGESLTAAIQSDSRFAEALTNQDKFGCVPLMDKYGRKSKKKTKSRREDNDVDAAENDMQEKQSKEEEPDIPENNGMESRIAYLNALSRGEISASTSDDDSSDDSSVEKASDVNSDDDSSSSIDVYGKAGVFDPSYNQLPGDAQDDEEGVELTDSPTPYLAILNLDWTTIRAVDIYAMLQSFCPPSTLKKVDVYPSDFGLEMMEKEKVHGPSGIWKKPKKNSISNASETEDTSSDPEDSENDDVDIVDNNSSEASSNEESDQEDVSEDDAEDIMNLNEATAKLYSHFPPQSEVAKKSRNGGGEASDEEEGFDREKLRAYEASKLRYYFAIATFTSPGAAEQVYNDVDGMEMEHSAAEIDVRALPADEYNDTIEGRSLRDTCNYLPGKYSPPDTVVAALRQSRVSCSWETGDAQRDKKLTQWGMGKDAWHAMAEGDDIKFYLASDHSSADEEGDSESEEEAKGRKQTKQKAANMRSLLGLADSDEDEKVDNSSEDNASSSEDEVADSSGQDEPSTKKMIFTPGKDSLENKIRSKINYAEEETEEQLTPFQKYLEKRKQKRRERKAAARNKRIDDAPEDDGMYEPDAEFGVAKFSDEESGDEAHDDTKNGEDDFFLEKNGNNKKGRKDKRARKDHQESDAKAGQASTKEELELLIAGDEGKFDRHSYILQYAR